MDYNATKGGEDNLDKLVTGYNCEILQHLGVERVCHLDGVEPRLEQREEDGSF
jgi:hypothetical protein